ncbi:glycosyltransferase [Bacillus thuringiensis]|uniref:glycosyltransferase n=2 Tax=Bacillus thuringiensis TaxID=1428 RepID=UPI000A3D1AF7|nr:glycosyltransferase [Bacillus thuringiensis]MED3351278.1 glycosyltransferase [Bacillus thuringiensis]MRB11730.1 glycosyltransferase [Bacillus thuringiensis]OTW80639.1 hypothetical protein BK710_23355 [Bacillus thuringiensis serovar sumiyoshiensis]PEB11217.1 hypothetical protein COM67_16765 [Bacillus thuringiensis]PEQ56355.1 hypothetical protein CN473_00515 [Bacillus thuringiensis]
MSNILYIVLSDIDPENLNSGPTVRSFAVLEEFRKTNNDVEMVYGSSAKERYRVFKEIMKKNKHYTYCYIESKVGVTRGYDSLIMLLLKLKVKPQKIGFYYRDMYWKYGIQVSTGNVKNKIVPWANRIYLKFVDFICDVVYGQSKSFCDALEDHIKKSDIKMLPPGCDDIEISNISSNEVLYVGEIDQQFSGIELLIDALIIANLNERVVLNLVCRKHEYEENQYLNEMNQRYDWIKISHHNKQTIKEVYKKSSLTIIPRSGNEYTKLCLPIKLFEYISYEKPIVAVNHGEVADFIAQHHLGLISNDTAEDLARKILLLLSENKVYLDIIKNIRNYKTHNKWSNRIEQINLDLSS